MVATRPITIEEFETMLLEGQWELIDGEAVVPAFLQALSLRFTAKPTLVATRARRVRDTLALDTPFQSIHTAVAAAAAGLIERTTAGAAGAALLCLVALQDTLSTYALFIEVKATPAGATASVIVHAAMRAAGAELVRLVRARLPDGVGRCRGRLLHGDARRRETARGIAAAAGLPRPQSWFPRGQRLLLAPMALLAGDSVAPALYVRVNPWSSSSRCSAAES